MGFFSWLTADTKESIPAAAAGFPQRPVYLLQPDGQEPICEVEYEGYGSFNGVHAYEWLARANASHLGIDLSSMSEEDIGSIGIGIDCGSACRVVETGEILHIFHDHSSIVPGRFLGITWADPIPGMGRSANELVAAGILEQVAISDLIDIQFPLKFSFDKNAVYEDLPASEECPYQGYFYEEFDDDESLH